MATEKAQTLANLRTKIFNDSLANEGKNRFGLFSYPPAGVIGSNNYNFNKEKVLGPDGKPVTKPRGIFPGPARCGKTESSYLSKTAYVSIGDLYVNPDSKDRQYAIEKKKKNNHEAEFRCADGAKSDPYRALFEHMPEYTNAKKNYRGTDGKVVIPPKNIFTNPPRSGHGDSTVGHLLSKGYDHKPDDYNRPQILAAKERAEHKKKLQEAPFRSTSHGNEPFNPPKKVFGKDDKVLKPVSKSISNEPLPKLHEQVFKPANPAKKGYNKTISKFPEYKPDPIKIAVRKFADPNVSKKENFRPNSTAYDVRPTPSISLNRQNLKNEMARISASIM